MSEKEKIKYVLGLLIEATKNNHGIFTCYVNDKEIVMTEKGFRMVFDDYKLEPYGEEFNRIITTFDGVKIYALTKEGFDDDF